MWKYEDLVYLEQPNLIKGVTAETTAFNEENGRLQWVWDDVQTTDVLTATILIYATDAGITAAAGTRLSHQLLIGMTFGYSSL
jgi:hypothetical protein